jgi:TMEM175 potassium channel family protein
MTKARLEAFSDGVIAIIITIMVLELRVPHSSDWNAVREILPSIFLYVLSFVFVGIYWANHHHLLHVTERINGRILWANLHLLFWLSLVPFITRWMGEAHFTSLPTAVYGVVLFLAAVAWQFLQNAIIAEQGAGSKLKAAIGQDRKGKLSAAAYAVAIPLAFLAPLASDALYVLVALIWLIPDRRIEAHLKHH